MPELKQRPPGEDGPGTTQGKIGLGLIIGYLGVVYGDIGTSLLYSISEAIFGYYPLALSPENILGAVSVFKWPKRYLLPFVAMILAVDLLFFGANILKFTAGGYVPIVIGLAMFLIMDTWRWGRQWVGQAYQRQIERHPMTVESLLDQKRYSFEHDPSISLVVMTSQPITGLKDHVPPVLSVHYRNWKRLPKPFTDYFGLEEDPGVTMETINV